MADTPSDDSGFLSRWSRRKALVRQGVAPADPVAAPVTPASGAAVVQPGAAAHPAAVTEPGPAAASAPFAPSAPSAPTAPSAPPAPPPPTLADVALLTRDSDYARFVAPGVDATVKNAALKRLFTDPHFNVMDRLDTYIDDYGVADPLPAGMLRKMAQSQFLGLFPEAQPAPDAAAAAAPTPTTLAQATPDEDAALRLQPHDAAGPAGPGEGAGPDTGRQC